MSATLILPGQTELKALQDNLTLLKDFTVVPFGEKLHKITRTVYFDLTFDIYQKSLTPSLLYSMFSESEQTVGQIALENVQIVALKSYPFRSNRIDLLVKQKLIDSYASVLAEFHRAKIVTVPMVISRHALTAVQNPPAGIIQSIRQGSAETSKFKKNSRFIVIYDRDLLGFFMNPEGPPAGNTVIDGHELTLEEIATRTMNVAGQAPVQFDSSNLIQYEYPQETAGRFQSVHYEFEDMIMDITSNLF